MSVSNKHLADSVPRLSMTMVPILYSPNLKLRRTDIVSDVCGGVVSKYMGFEVKIFSKAAPFVMYSVKKYGTSCSNIIKGDSYESLCSFPLMSTRLKTDWSLGDVPIETAYDVMPLSLSLIPPQLQVIKPMLSC